jgi:hypothetical protein
MRFTNIYNSIKKNMEGMCGYMLIYLLLNKQARKYQKSEFERLSSTKEKIVNFSLMFRVLSWNIQSPAKHRRSNMW